MLLHKKSILNILLALLVCSLGVILYLRWTREIPTLPVSTVPQEVKSAKKTRNNTQTIPGEATYKAVTEKNLFAANRQEYVPEPAPLETEEKPVKTIAKISDKVIELQGVIQIGDKYSGLILNPDIEAERKQKWVVAGDRIGDLQITEIFPDMIALQDSKEKFEIKLSDRKKTKTPSASTLKPAPKVASAGTINKSTAPANKPKEKTTIIPPIKSKDEKTSQEIAEMTKVENNSKEASVINTPFGDVTRKK